MDVVLQLRGSNNATVKDIVELRKLVRTTTTAMATELQRMLNKSRSGKASNLDMDTPAIKSSFSQAVLESSNSKAPLTDCPDKGRVTSNPSPQPHVTESLDFKGTWQPDP